MQKTWKMIFTFYHIAMYCGEAEARQNVLGHSEISLHEN